jgi:hypothetical protein
MSDYTKSTDFASKDALASGNAAKIVKGTEIDTEFNNIATAIATKANLASPGFSGTPTAPTASSGDNTTKLATTAFVTSAISTSASSTLASVYPVGSIYINASVSTNPATLLGFGTWTAFGAGRVMVGLNAADASFDTAEETGGSKDATVVSHTHSVTDPGHSHTLQKLGSAQAGSDNGGAPISASTGYTTTRDLSPTNSASTGISIQSTGSSGTNANLQPYIVVYMWKRTV